MRELSKGAQAGVPVPLRGDAAIDSEGGRFVCYLGFTTYYLKKE